MRGRGEEKREKHTCYEFRRGWRQEARNHYLEPRGGSGLGDEMGRRGFRRQSMRLEFS